MKDDMCVDIDKKQTNKQTTNKLFLFRPLKNLEDPHQKLEIKGTGHDFCLAQSWALKKL